MTDHTKLETTAMDRIEVAKAIYHAAPRNKPFDKLSAFKRERILAEADAFLASLSAAGYRVIGPGEVTTLQKALSKAEDGAGTLPAREAVKLRPADWHSLCSLVRALGRKA